MRAGDVVATESRRDSITGRVAPMVDKHCDTWFPRTKAERDAYHRKEREIRRTMQQRTATP